MRKVIIAIAVLLIITLWGSACWAKDPATPEIKLQEAIDMALKNSDSIKKSALDIEKAKEQRESAEDAVSYAPGASQNAAADTAWYGLLSADLSWQMSQKTYASDEDALVLDVCQKYWDVQNAQRNVSSKEIDLAKTELATRRIKAMIRLGMTPSDSPQGSSPEMALKSAEAALEKAKADLVDARNSLNTDYESFNQAVGLWPEDRPALVDEVSFEPLKDVVLEAEVNRVLVESPNVWLAEEGIDLANFAYEKMWASGQYTSYEVRKIEKEQAELDAISAKDAVALATRNLYYMVRNLEAKIPGAENGVAAAEEALRVAKLSYDLGMITKESLTETEASLAVAKKTLLELKTSHAYAKMAFQKPWAASTGA